MMRSSNRFRTRAKERATRWAQSGRDHRRSRKRFTPKDASVGPIARKWNFYRREAGRLLAEGHEGKWLLVKGDAIIGIFDTEDEARAIALQKYLMQPCLIRQVPLYAVCRSDPVGAAPARRSHHCATASNCSIAALTVVGGVGRAARSVFRRTLTRSAHR
jgi:hypothetical protein